MYAWQARNLSVGSVVALITLIDNAYTPIAIFNVIYVQYKLNRASFLRYEEFLDLQDDKQLAVGIAPQVFSGKISVRKLSFRYGENLAGISLEAVFEGWLYGTKKAWKFCHLDYKHYLKGQL